MLLRRCTAAFCASWNFLPHNLNSAPIEQCQQVCEIIQLYPSWALGPRSTKIFRFLTSSLFSIRLKPETLHNTPLLAIKESKFALYTNKILMIRFTFSSATIQWYLSFPPDIRLHTLWFSFYKSITSRHLFPLLNYSVVHTLQEKIAVSWYSLED